MNEKIEFKKIENNYKFCKSKFMKELSIWEEIAMQINSYNGKKQKFWIKVMNLYHKKYTQKI